MSKEKVAGSTPHGPATAVTTVWTWRHGSAPASEATEDLAVGRSAGVEKKVRQDLFLVDRDACRAHYLRKCRIPR